MSTAKRLKNKVECSKCSAFVAPTSTTPVVQLPEHDCYRCKRDGRGERKCNGADKPCPVCHPAAKA